jgi:hypothetical protein
MSLATVQYQTQYKKLFFKHGDKVHNLATLIGPWGMKIADILYEIDPAAKADGSDRVYIKLYRRLKYLARKKIFALVNKQQVDWFKTEQNRNKEIENGIQAIFRDAVTQPPAPIVSTRTLTTETDSPISTVKKTDIAFTVVPTGQLFYLFSQVQNSNTDLKSANEPSEKQGTYWDRLFQIPQRCSTERVTAIKTLMGIKGPAPFRRDLTCPTCKKTGVYQPGRKVVKCICGNTWKPPLNRELKNELQEIQSNFGEWEERTINQELFFDRGPGTAMVRLPSTTRFTNTGRKVKNIRTYDRGWNRANQLYRRGVFLTLTTDPAMHKDLWEANRHLSFAWNKYLSLLLSRKRQAKKKGYNTELDEHDAIDDGLGRLRYIAAYEFMENGLIHLHVCFFGIRYLAKMDQIAEDWKQCGQGKIAHAYGIKKNGEVWEWNREQPNDANGKNPVDYLRKYLEKALYVSTHFPMYWTMNKRFCTMSRILQTKECVGCRTAWGSAVLVCPNCGGPLRTVSQGFRYLGSLEKGYSPTMPMMKRNRGSSPFDPLGWVKPGVPA